MLWSLSAVPIERQKIMCAGKTLKDDEWNIPLKNVSYNFRLVILIALCFNIVVGSNLVTSRHE